MALPKPNLDDRTFQQIVDDAKRMIPRLCPEWTDHNVSDPGVTLIELFAWMTEMLLYRVNQVPDKVYLAFLDMIGVRLGTTLAAQVPVTFYLSAPLEAAHKIPRGTVVGTPRTETSPSVLFSTEPRERSLDAYVLPPKPIGLYHLNASRLQGRASEAWTKLDLDQLRRGAGQDGAGPALALFPRGPMGGDTFSIALAEDLSHHVVSIILDVKDTGADPAEARPVPITWEVSYDSPLWRSCVVEFDSSRGLSQPGRQIIVLRLPEMKQRKLDALPDIDAFWLQCRINPNQRLERSPQISGLALESRGITLTCRQAMLVEDEFLGRSDGTPGQVFQLQHSPVLDLDPATDYLGVTPPGGEPEYWMYRDDFADAGPEDRCFSLDKLSGTISLGPMLIQPDGKVYRFGAVPTKDAELRFSRYRWGGGTSGNVAPRAISVLKESLPFVSEVTNWEPAQGGRDQQTLEDARMRAPHYLRTRMRAVTADDYEYLTLQKAGVARAKCLGAGQQPNKNDEPRPGEVRVIVIPQTDLSEGDGWIDLGRLALGQDLRVEVQNHLNDHALVGTSVEVRSPDYIDVTVDVRIIVANRLDDDQIEMVKKRAEATLYRYLNPYTGGPEGDGWGFGRPLHVSEIFGLLQNLPNVEFVEGVKLSPPSRLGLAAGQRRIAIPPHAVICSGRHNVMIRRTG